MEPPGDHPDLPDQAWLRWLTDPLQDVEPQVRAVLLRELLASPGSLLTGMASGMLMSVVGLILHFEPLLAAFGVLQVAVAGWHAAIVLQIARRAPPGGGVPTAASVATSIASCGTQGGLACAFMLGDIPQLKVLSAAMIMGMTGPICARNYPAPRLAALLVVLCVAPLTAGGCLSGEDGLQALALMTPPFLHVAWRMILANQKLAVSALSAGLDSARHARRDPLTGLGNRLGFTEALLRPGREGSDRCAMLCLDLDGFKAVNDTLGHHAGDLLLQAVARRLEAVLRPGDRIFRLGGDEFTILVEGLPVASIGALAERVIAAIGAEPFQLPECGQAQVGVSVGYACAPEDGPNLAELHRKADAALYASKAAGKGVHRRFEPRLVAA